MIMRIGIVGEKLEAGVAVDTLRARASHGIGESVGRNRARIRVAERAGDFHRICRRGILRLQAIARLAEVHGVSPDVTNLQDPLAAQRTLYRQVPLLRAGHDEMPRHLKTENVRGEERTRASRTCGGSVVRSLSRVVPRESLEHRKARHECWIK